MTILATNARRYGLCALATMVALLGSPLRGQETSDPGRAVWDTLVTASSGSRVKLVFRDGTNLVGTLVDVESDTILVSDVVTGPRGVVTRSGSSADGLTFRRGDVATATILSVPRAGSRPPARSFAQLSGRVRPGETLTIDPEGDVPFSGVVSSVSPSSLQVRVGGTMRTVEEKDVARIQHRGNDSLANGAKWGLGVGAATGILACTSCHVGPGLVAAGLYGAIGAGIGVGVDALIRGNVVVYESRRSTRRVTVAPQLARSHKAVTVSVDF